MDQIKKIKNELQRPFPFYFNDQRRNFWLIVSVSLFVVLFLFLYQPFNQYSLRELAAYGPITFFILFLNVFGLPFFFPRWFEPAVWSLKKYILFNLFIFLMMGIAVSAFSALFICGWAPLWNLYLINQVHVVLVGVLPLFVITFVIQNSLLKENLRQARSASEKLKTIKSEHPDTDGILTIQSDTSETLSFHSDDFIMARAEDNYTTFFLKKNSKITHVLVRITLKNTERQLNFPYIFRPHRSYLVNLLKINAINGNANGGYKLLMDETGEEIPVSRQNGKQLLRTIDQLSEN